ncbi:VCBS repeat-containing protein, partial [candidate division KSB1 bacterium]|nr:VCBS repeat-containing protein [candidate division KSB1 bacterium]
YATLLANHGGWQSLISNSRLTAPYKTALLRTSNSRIQFKISIPGMYIDELEAPNQKYDLISLPECGFNSDAGHPQLPQIIKLIAIPTICQKKDIQIDIISTKYTDFKNIMLCPVPRPIKQTVSPGIYCQINQYAEETSAYLKNEFAPKKLVEIEEIGFIREQKIIRVVICPFQYNPVTRWLRAFSEVEIAISFKDGLIFTSKGLGPWENLTSELFLNHELAKNGTLQITIGATQVSYPTDLRSHKNHADYIIITTDSLIANPALDSFANHRAQFSQFDVAVVKISDIYQQFPDSTCDSSIKAFLIYAFNNWQALHFGDGHFGYVLLVGEGAKHNTNEVPTRFIKKSVFEYSVDTWYTCVNDDNADNQIDDHDQIPDLIVGRFSVENHQELSTIAKKTVNFEKTLCQQQVWQREISLVSGFVLKEIHASRLFCDIKKLMNKQDYFHIAETLDRFEDDPETLRNSFLAAFNDGRGIITVHSHGGVDGWGDSQGWILFQSSEIPFLSNEAKPSIVLSLSCDTGNFSYLKRDCIGEKLVNEPDKGAVAFFGASAVLGIGGLAETSYNIAKAISSQTNFSLGSCLFITSLFKSHFIGYNLLGDPALSFIYPAQHGMADLTIPSDEIFVNWSPSGGQSEIITATVYNLGFKQAQEILVQYFKGDPQNGGDQIGDDQIIGFIAGMGGHQTLQIESDDIVERMISLYIQIDPYNQIPEINEGNNLTLYYGQEPLFHNIAVQAGVADTNWGVNAAFGDFNDDNFLDLCVTNLSSTHLLYRNKGDGLFIESTTSAGITDLKNKGGNISFIDFNNDGMLDIFMDRNNVFFQNVGMEQFIPIKITIDDSREFTDKVIGFLDFNNDGLLDLFCFRGLELGNSLYRNMGNAVFKDFTLEAGVDSMEGSSCVAFSDYDNDGDMDIFVNRGYPKTNMLYKNQGDGIFLNIAKAAGLETINSQGDNVDFGDYNNDGKVDLFISGQYYWSNPSQLFKNKGDGTFQNVTASAKLDSANGGARVKFLDYDNDGYLDIFHANRIIYKNNGNCSFSIDSFAFSQNSISFFDQIDAIGDYDNDGDLDFYDAVLLDNSRMNRLYQNRGNHNHWIVVRLTGTQSNSFGIGARLRVVTGNMTQIRDVICETGSGLQTSLPVEFGLGQYSKIDTLKIRWPSGITDILTNVQVDQIITIKEDYGDVSIPTTHNLFTNFPNPFNLSTTIHFSVGGNPYCPRASLKVSLKIYNVLGQFICTLVEAVKPSGHYSVKWNGADQNGIAVASGIYLYQLSVGDMRIHNKMLLLR